MKRFIIVTLLFSCIMSTTIMVAATDEANSIVEPLLEVAELRTALIDRLEELGYRLQRDHTSQITALIQTSDSRVGEYEIAYNRADYKKAIELLNDLSIDIKGLHNETLRFLPTLIAQSDKQVLIIALHEKLTMLSASTPEHIQTLSKIAALLNRFIFYGKKSITSISEAQHLRQIAAESEATEEICACCCSLFSSGRRKKD